MTSSNKKDTRLVKQYEANKRYHDRMKCAGMVQIRVWVPVDKKKHVQAYAGGLRNATQTCIKR